MLTQLIYVFIVQNRFTHSIWTSIIQRHYTQVLYIWIIHRLLMYRLHIKLSVTLYSNYTIKKDENASNQCYGNYEPILESKLWEIHRNTIQNVDNEERTFRRGEVTHFRTGIKGNLHCSGKCTIRPQKMRITLRIFWRILLTQSAYSAYIHITHTQYLYLLYIRNEYK